ncbi:MULTISPECIES: efflux RND transporter periplasmic adaptor subunit [unclassified Shewanella]|uniref:efflux RND transporter periplasmic adaptor subunit n=1 Tax=unclassified Shewanella TaxID=196818 RepID=UPI000C855C47|nr:MULTISPECIES: efflux RND transporter periplasmic adaptor subunit [unclassified Shewanella]MDO6618898.1 efflux RND transporter periplasmic adaptor subunit [Shewanella sp. 6_MG-2023]MDO6640451.1 efflux RND transporter periplasmic adaptor subunit [Shewanella sp. 5_MG-2023]MDO6677913.1 efflux RND transporter periplasmic adaptor subunit [Shewanella sp. 4_MG-2023]MDO6775291.1 efflux RND transporter periplasmic adaptor subunit [Shewanella sp. 3_MG-2023]PMG29630.1 efflux transporter periplasmic ada
MERFNNIKKFTSSVFCITAFSIMLSGCNGEQETAAEEEKYAVPVEVSQVTQGNVSSFYSTTATLEAPEEAHVVTRIAGLITSINVEEGDRVTKGQALATIDAKRQQFDYQRALAEVQIIEQELNRLKQMKNKEFVSQDVMAKLEFNLQAAMAQRDLAELYVIESRIVSPIDGIVATRHVKKGNMAKEFEELFYIVNQDELHGIVHLPEQQLNSLRLGQEARISNQYANNKGSTEQDIIANVLRISPIVDAQSGTFKVTIAINNKDATLKAGMFTRVELKYDTHNDVVTVPFNAIINQDDTQALYVIKDNTANRREVILGYRENDKVEILSGVQSGEQIVIRGQQNLKDLSLVEIISPLSYAKNSLASK